jgi:hypothetical protein
MIDIHLTWGQLVVLALLSGISLGIGGFLEAMFRDWVNERKRRRQ